MSNCQQRFFKTKQNRNNLKNVKLKKNNNQTTEIKNINLNEFTEKMKLYIDVKCGNKIENRRSIENNLLK